jgi:hypothetical protein
MSIVSLIIPFVGGLHFLCMEGYEPQPPHLGRNAGALSQVLKKRHFIPP